MQEIPDLSKGTSILANAEVEETAAPSFYILMFYTRQELPEEEC